MGPGEWTAQGWRKMEGGVPASVSSSILRLLLPPARPVWALISSSHFTPYYPSTHHSLLIPGVKAKKPIQTKFRMPLLNWVALKPSQITGTVFTELNDEKVLQVSVDLLGSSVGTRGGGDLRGSCWALGVVISSPPSRFTDEDVEAHGWALSQTGLVYLVGSVS